MSSHLGFILFGQISIQKFQTMDKEGERGNKSVNNGNSVSKAAFRKHNLGSAHTMCIITYLTV